MHAPALALAWQLGGRHRRGLAAALVTCLAGAALAAGLPEDAEARRALCLFGLLAALPATLFHVFAVFAYGLDGAPLEGRQSGFPARQFTLPVRTAALVGWPMLYGTAATALTWLAWAGLVFRPAGMEELPLAWPAALLAVILAWLQAILWSPFGLPWVRLFVAVLVPTGLVVLASFGVTHGVPEPVLTAVLAALLVPAYLAAWAGVARARRGDVPEWGWPTARPGAAAVPVPGVAPFASAAGAQRWYEGRQHGLLFPFLLLFLFLPLTGWVILLVRVGPDAGAGALLPFLLRFSPETRTVYLLFHPLLLVPPFLAGVLSGGLGSLGPKLQVSPFLMTRPVTAGALVTAKLQSAARSVLLGTVLTLLAGLGWLLLSGTGPQVAGWWGQVEAFYGPARAHAMPVLTVVALVGLTWLQLCGGMILGLAGRVWARLVPALAALALGGLALLLQWLRQHPQHVEAALAGLAWVLGVLVLVKAGLAAWALRAVWRRRLWGADPVASVFGVWLLTAGCLLVLVAWLVPPGGVPSAVPPLGVVLVLPLPSILAAPLALEWNRHR